MKSLQEDGIKTCKCLKGHCAHYQSDFDRFVKGSALLAPQKPCSTHPQCSHNTNGRDMNKPCSIAFSTPQEEREAFIKQVIAFISIHPGDSDCLANDLAIVCGNYADSIITAREAELRESLAKILKKEKWDFDNSKSDDTNKAVYHAHNVTIDRAVEIVEYAAREIRNGKE